MSKFREWLSESLKFAVAVAFFLGLQQIPVEFDTLGAEVVKQFLEALVAGLLAYITTEWLFARPTIELRWSMKPEIYSSGRPDLVLPDGQRLAFQVEMHLSGTSQLARWICRRSTHRPLDITISFRPAQLTVITLQGSPRNNVAATQSSFTFRDIELVDGMNEYIGLSIRHRDTGPVMPTPMNFIVTTQPSRKSYVPFAKLLGISRGIDGFTVRKS